MRRNFRKIKVWQQADDLAVEVYLLTKHFPKEELYGITSQLRRAVSSVPANIAEGANRGTVKEFIHFLNIARGSLAEAEYFVHLSHRLFYVNDSDYSKTLGRIDSVGALLHGLMRAVRNNAKSDSLNSEIESTAEVCSQ